MRLIPAGAMTVVERFLPKKWRAPTKLLLERPVATPKGRVPVSMDADAKSLERIKHIVVVMLENRSYDHMLGYLSLPEDAGGRGRTDLDGLQGAKAGPYGAEHPIEHLERTALDGEAEDPDHSAAATDDQLKGLWVESFAKYLARLKDPPAVLPDIGLPMRYYDGDDLPMYDHLASEFCVCDRWFSSVAGATWPNRLYAVTGGARTRDDHFPPLYNEASFTRFLGDDPRAWRWYSFDPGSLRAIDAEHRLRNHHHFAYVDRRKLTRREEAAGVVFEEGPSFVEDAAAGDLPHVAWIDPHFKDLRAFGPDSNDDHPPSDVMAGQDLVLTVYHALRSNQAAWERTLLVVTYDEHGGFYDHVTPPAAPDDNPDPDFQRYGVRVPALVVSPLVEPGPAPDGKVPFDHTSIIKTILLRFCESEGTIPDMGQRVTKARHLGGLLTRTEPRRDIESYDDVIERMTDWRTGHTSARYEADPAPSTPLRQRTTDLQSGVLETATLLRKRGLPPGQP